MDVEKLYLETDNHWSDRNLEGYIYYNLFSDQFYKQINRVINSLYNKTSHDQYLTHTTSFNLNNKSVSIVSSGQSNRYQETPFDLTFNSDWDNQTVDTIYDWTDNILRTKYDPVFYKVVKLIETLPPYSFEPKKWTCFRLHLNVLTYGEFLSLHKDSGSYIFNKNDEDIRMYSTTVYLHDHIEGQGGEIFSPEALIFKPKQNSALTLNGHHVIHGVNANMREDKKTRLAFTMRWGHIEDYHFGNTAKFNLYKKVYND